MLIAQKKKFLISIIGAAVLVLGFWAIQAPEAEALTLTKSNTCPFGYASELECYNDAAGNSGYTGCLSSVECCLACNSYRSTCAIVDAGTDHFTEYEFNADGTGSCNDTSVLSCQSGLATGACPNTASYDGKQCIVRKVDSSDANKILYNNSDTYWDGPNKRCIACGWWDGPGDGLTRNNTEIKKCGDTSGVYLDSSGNCNSTSLDLFKFKTICGADAACDGKVYPDNGSAPSCTGGTCNLDGQCVAPAAITVSANPNSVVQNAANNIVFTVNENGAIVSITGAGVTPANCTVVGGTCTISSVIATVVGSISVSAAKAGFTTGTTTIAVTAAGGLTVTPNPSSIPASTNTNVNFFVRKPDGTPASFADVSLSSGGGCNVGVPGFCSYTVNSASNVTVTAVLAGFPNGVAIITIAAAGCTTGACNGVQWCPVNGGPWQNCPGGQTCVGGVCVPAGPGACNQLACGGAVSNQPCMCGLQLVSANGDYCCAINNFYGTLANCQASDPACAGGGGAEICTGGADEDGDGDVDCDDSDCAADPACVAIPPAASCSGPGMFVSPLGPGYCTIGEILENATNWILALVSSIIILIIIIGGLMYISSAGDEEKLRTSKNIIFYAIVGLGIILISYALITEVTDILEGP